MSRIIIEGNNEELRPWIEAMADGFGYRVQRHSLPCANESECVFLRDVLLPSVVAMRDLAVKKHGAKCEERVAYENVMKLIDRELAKATASENGAA